MNPIEQLTKDKLYKIKMPESLFSDADKQKLRNIIANTFDVSVHRMPDWDKWRTDRGLWTKRFQSWMYNAHRRKLEPEFLSKLGGELGQMFVRDTFYLDFTNHANWEPGAFGEYKNSCWFTPAYGHSRLGLFEHGGLAVRLFSSPRQRSINKGTKGIGRAWLLPHEDCLYLFNAYGFGLFVFGGILSNILNIKGQMVDSFNLNESYINSEKSIAFSTTSYNIKDYLPSINSKWVGNCKHCNELVKKGLETTISIGDEIHLIYHPNCRDEAGKTCRDCDNFRLNNHMQTDRLCKKCYSYYKRCPVCKEKKRYQELAFKDAHRVGVCRDCISKLPQCICTRIYISKAALKRHEKECKHALAKMERDRITRKSKKKNLPAKTGDFNSAPSLRQVTPTVLAGGINLEPTTHRQEFEFIGRTTVDRLYSPFTNIPQEFYDRYNPGQPEQAQEGIRESLPGQQNTIPERAWDAADHTAISFNFSGIHNNNWQQDTPIESNVPHFLVPTSEWVQQIILQEENNEQINPTKP